MIYSYDSKVSMLEWGHLEGKAMLIATGSGEVSTHSCIPIASPSGEFRRRLPGQMGSGYGPVVEGVGGANAADQSEIPAGLFHPTSELFPS